MPGALSTIEAIVAALNTLEAPERYDDLLRPFEALIEGADRRDGGGCLPAKSRWLIEFWRDRLQPADRLGVQRGSGCLATARVFCLRMYSVTSVALSSIPTRAQTNGTSQQETLMLIHIVAMA